jgi:hypothetical protein
MAAGDTALSECRQERTTYQRHDKFGTIWFLSASLMVDERETGLWGDHNVVTSEQETVRTILALTAMEANIKVLAADISNSFLYGKNIEKTNIKAGSEFGELQGQYIIVEGGWYGHKLAAATLHAHLATKLRKWVLNRVRQIWIFG